MNVAQSSLFGETAIPIAEKRETRLSERRRKAKLAYTATSEIWKKATKKFAIENFLPNRNPFLFEELSDAYEKWARDGGGPQTVQKKAFAGLQRVLIREKKIELIQGATRLRSNGQVGLLYRSLV